jgi:hypothetical protein
VRRIISRRCGSLDEQVKFEVLGEVEPEPVESVAAAAHEPVPLQRYRT